MSRYRVSADIGGTFTDIVFYDVETGRFKAGKTLSTPQNLSDAIIRGIDEEIEDYSQIEYFVHGNTAGLNAVLQRRGAKVALITTKGFHDLYELGRGNRTDLYNMRYHKPKPLIQLNDVFEVEERIMADGSIETPLDQGSVIQAAKAILEGGYDSVAVCLLNSYRNNVHEIQLREIIAPLLPGKAISLSCVIAREWREYERMSTVIMNAYIAPIVRDYLAILENRMHSKSFEENVYVMHSGGGVITSNAAREVPIQAMLSGPVGGAIGNDALGKLTGYQNLVGVDMGGTSYDVSLVVNGRPDVSTETHFEGFPILTPMINIFTIGAGGGSIAWVQNGGLRVGPISAGADPGPACYGNGGKKPTITDANVVLGHIAPDGFLGGRMSLDKEAARRAVKTVADELGLSIEETAEGICKIADAKMAGAIRQITVRKGLDPRTFVLVAYGGAGPMQACSTADELGIKTILVPEMPGTFSAWGMHQSDIRQDAVRTITAVIEDMAPSQMQDAFLEMKAEVSENLLSQDIDPSQIEYLFSADMRYHGQDSTINVALESGPINEGSLRLLRQSFDARHLSIHGHNNPTEKVDLVNLRLTGLGKLARADKTKYTEKVSVLPMPRKKDQVIFHGKEYETRFYEREKLHYGNELDGPLVVEELTTTTVVPPEFHVRVDEYLNLVITKNEDVC